MVAAKFPAEREILRCHIESGDLSLAWRSVTVNAMAKDHATRHRPDGLD